MDAVWVGRWRRAVVEANAALEAAGKARSLALAYTYARIGSDCGRVLRMLHERGVSWGTYQDGMCLDGKTVGNLGQYHCNAHSNNFVALPDHATDHATDHASKRSETEGVDSARVRLGGV